MLSIKKNQYKIVSVCQNEACEIGDKLIFFPTCNICNHFDFAHCIKSSSCFQILISVSEDFEFIADMAYDWKPQKWADHLHRI